MKLKTHYSRRRVEITLAGTLFSGITLLVLVAAINSGTNLLYILFGLMVGTMALSAVMTAISLRAITVRRIMAAHVVAGEAAEIEYVVHNHKRWWPCFAIYLTEAAAEPPLSATPLAFMLHLPARTEARGFGRLLASRRGITRLHKIRLRCAFPFGLIMRSADILLPDELIVYPRVGTLNRKVALQYREAADTGTMSSSIRGGADEFYGIREYRAGDNVRAIHWRSTARTGRFLVREMTANAPPQLIVVLNLRSWRRFVSAEAVRGGVPDRGPGEERRKAAGVPEDAGREAAERAIELAATLICDAFLQNFSVALDIAGIVREPGAAAPTPMMGRDARAGILRQLAMLDIEQVREQPLSAPAAPVNRFAARAECVVVSLQRADSIADLVPGSAGGNMHGRGQNRRFLLMAMDDADAAERVHPLVGGRMNDER